MKKYTWLTKELLEQAYRQLGDFKKISQKYDVPRTTIEKYCKDFGIKTKPKIHYNVDDNIFANDTETSFYLAGFIAADGCIVQHKCNEPNCLSICLSEKDKDHLLKLKNMFQFTGPIKTNVAKHSNKNENWKDARQSKMNIYSKQIISDLKRFGIGPRKSLTYEFPEWLKSHILVNHFMRGYFDGDGSLFKTRECRRTQKYGPRLYEKMSFGLRGTNAFLLSFKNILGSQSITVPKFNNGIDQLVFSGNKQVREIVKFLYKNSTIYMDRKYNVAKELL